MPVSTVDFVLHSTYTTSGFHELMSCALFSSLSPPLASHAIAGWLFGYIGSMLVLFPVEFYFGTICAGFPVPRNIVKDHRRIFLLREYIKENYAVQRSQIHGGQSSPDGGRLHQVDAIQGLLCSCWSDGGFLGIWVRLRQAGTDADGFDRGNDWPDLCWFGRIARHSRSIDGIQRKRKGSEVVWCPP